MTFNAEVFAGFRTSVLRVQDAGAKVAGIRAHTLGPTNWIVGRGHMAAARDLAQGAQRDLRDAAPAA